MFSYILIFRSEICQLKLSGKLIPEGERVLCFRKNAARTDFREKFSSRKHRPNFFGSSARPGYLFRNDSGDPRSLPPPKFFSGEIKTVTNVRGFANNFDSPSGCGPGSEVREGGVVGHRGGWVGLRCSDNLEGAEDKSFGH